jgi:hypothetical protein
MIRLTSLDGWREATFEGPEMVYRFHLGQQLTEANRRSLLVIGLNPSTADHLEDDRTIAKLTRLARAMDFDRLDMTNIDPFRSTDPKNLVRAPEKSVSNPYAPPIHASTRRELELNLAVIRWLACRADLVLCAWGGPYSPVILGQTVARRAELVAEALKRDAVKLTCLATAKGGEPRHPLYLKDELRPVPWEPRA